MKNTAHFFGFQAAYRCHACKHGDQTLKGILEHSWESHPHNELARRKRILNEAKGTLGYQTLRFGVIPDKSNKTLTVDGDIVTLLQAQAKPHLIRKSGRRFNPIHPLNVQVTIITSKQNKSQENNTPHYHRIPAEQHMLITNIALIKVKDDIHSELSLIVGLS